MAAASGYDAFISYSHEHDRVLGPRLQSGLQRFAKPWYRMRALRIFRDTTDLTAGPGLWSSIDEALQESRWFILLASPEAAGSSNVDREVQWWLDHRSVNRLIIVGTAVGLAWDERHGDWAAGAPVPRALRGAFGSEPIWVDLSDVASSGQTARIPDDRLAEVAAPIRGVRKDALVGEHLRQRRRVMQLAGGTIAFLLALAVGLAAVSVLAVRARDESDRQRDMAVSRLLYIQSQALSDAHPMLARQESIASWRINPSVQARYAMLNAAASPGGTIFTARGLVDGLAFSSGSGTLLSASINGTVQRWDVATGQQIGRSLQTGNAGFLDSEPFTPDARITAGLGPGSTLRLWDPATRHLTGRPLAVNPDTSWVALSAGGTVAVTGTNDSLAQVWDVATGQQIGSNLKVHPLALSPDGRILAAGDGPGAVQLWNTETGKPIGGPLETKLATPTEAVFSPDGGILAVGSYYNVLLFNVATHTLIGSPLVSGWVQSLAFSRNGAVLAAGCNDGTVMLWNVTTQQQMGSTLTGENSGGPVQAVAFSRTAPSPPAATMAPYGCGM